MTDSNIVSNEGLEVAFTFKGMNLARYGKPVFTDEQYRQLAKLVPKMLGQILHSKEH